MLQLTWWVGMAALVISSATAGTAYGALARRVFYGCLVTTAVLWGVELVARRGVPRT